VPFQHAFKAKKYFWDEENAALPNAKSLSNELSLKIPYRIDFPDGNHYYGQITSGYYYFLDLINITVKAAWLLGIPSKEISHVIQNYHPEPTRTEIWKSSIGTTFINESYCSDPQSIDKALKHFEQTTNKNRKVFVFGGMRGKKNRTPTDYQRVAKAILRAQLDWLILQGKHPFAPLIEEINKHSPRTEISLCSDYSETLQLIRARIKPEDTVLIKGEKKESLDSLTETFNDSICNNQCFINLAAIKSNIHRIRRKLPPHTRIMVIVKALAYGTDNIHMSKFLATCGIDILGVSYVDEGVVLKRAGVSQAIFVINAAHYEATKIVKWDLEVGVSDKALIESIAAEAVRQNKKIKVHLHVDTGMGRFGCRPEDVLPLAKIIKDCPHLALEGIMTHFACADNAEDDSFTLLQASRFEKVIDELKSHRIAVPYTHAANSSAALRFNFPKFNMVRIGLAVYGL
jgi:alanine racemase/UDP-N-acetylmuramoyl-tripeptide--D-alanyl-D-alanine ligase